MELYRGLKMSRFIKHAAMKRLAVHIIYAVISAVVLLGMQCLLFLYVASPLIFTTGLPPAVALSVLAFSLGGTTALIAGFVFGNSTLCKRDPLGCLIGNSFVFAILVIFNILTFFVYDLDVIYPRFMPTGIFLGYGIYNYWPNYIFLIASVLALIVTTRQNDKLVRKKHLKRSTSHVLLASAIVFIVVSCITINDLYAAYPGPASDASSYLLAVNVEPTQTISIKGGNEMQPGAYSVSTQAITFDPGTHAAYSISCARVSGLSDKTLETRINQTLQEASTNWLTKDTSWMAYSKLNITCKTARYLSVLYTLSDTEDKYIVVPRPGPLYGIVINMQTGKRVYLDTLVDNVAELQNGIEVYDGYTPSQSGHFIASLVIHSASVSEYYYCNISTVGDDSISVEDDPAICLGEKSSFYLTDTQLVVVGGDGFVSSLSPPASGNVHFNLVPG